MIESNLFCHKVMLTVQYFRAMSIISNRWNGKKKHDVEIKSNTKNFNTLRNPWVLLHLLLILHIRLSVLFLLFRSIDWRDDGTAFSVSRPDIPSSHWRHIGAALRGGRLRWVSSQNSPSDKIHGLFYFNLIWPLCVSNGHVRLLDRTEGAGWEAESGKSQTSSFQQ